MLKNYRKDIIALAAIFGFMGYAIYVCAAPKQKEVITATRGDKVEAPAKAAPATKPVKAKEVVVKPEVKKEHKKKPTLKAKYADKK